MAKKIKNMKFLGIIFLFIGLSGVVIFKYFHRSIVPNQKFQEEIPTPFISLSPPATTGITVKDSPYAYAYIKVDPDNDHVELIPNFTNIINSRVIKTNYHCEALINAGFYDTDNKPLGLFKTENQIYGNAIRSNLLNGYIWNFNGYYISTEVPSDHVSWIMQSGPVLFQSTKPVILSIRNDEPDRRSVAITTTDHMLYFFILFNKDINTSGPELELVPQLLSQIAYQEKITILDAINLDGGSASSYISTDIFLSELTHIGSAFCIHKY